MVQLMWIFNIFFLIIILNSTISNGKTIVGKVKVIDGDTIHIDRNKIRLHGIDAPEINQSCIFNKNDWPCGKESRNGLKKLINDQIIECNITDIDVYNRYIGICSANALNLNREMVKLGWAIAYRYYSKDYIIEEKYAQDNKLGIWKGKFEEPYLFRKRNK